MPYTAKKLALLFVLRNQVDSEKKVRSSPRAGAATPQMNNLKRVFCDLFDAYNNSLVSYIKAMQAEANKPVCLPLLNHQLAGPLLQYDHAWNRRKKDVDGCPCCLHVSTMAVKLQADVNTKNCKLHAKALAGGGDGKFIAISALYSCCCLLNNFRSHQGGYGCFDSIRKAADGKTPVEQGPGVCGFDCMVCKCDCRCVFMQHSQQKIATGVMQVKKWLEDAKKIDSNGGDALPEATRRTAWTEFVMLVIKNCNIQESQPVNGRSLDKQLQDVASLAAMDAYLDLMMAQDANVSRGLWKVILLLRNANYCADDGTMRPMMLARVMAAEKHCGETEKYCGEVVSIVDHTPPPADFLRNSNTSNCVQQNRLDVPTAAAVAALTSTAALPTSVPAPISMVK